MIKLGKLVPGDREGAAASLCTLRGKSRAGIEAELDKMAVEVDESNAKTASVSFIIPPHILI